MAELTLKNLAGKKIGAHEVPDAVVTSDASDHLLWEIAVAYEANQRVGTHKTKTRAEVKGAGRKLWKQKHTGRARMGSIRSPLWRHGGTVHGPVPRDYRKFLSPNKKKVALRRALSDLVATGSVIVIDDLQGIQPKTQALVKVLKALDAKGRVLLVDASDNRNLVLAGRNLQKVEVRRVADLHAYDLMLADVLFISMSAITRLQEALSS